MDIEFEAVGLLSEKEAARRLLSYSVDITICFIDTINFQKDTHYAPVAGVSEFICGCKERMCSYSNVYTEMFKKTCNNLSFPFVNTKGKSHKQKKTP